MIRVGGMDGRDTTRGRTGTRSRATRGGASRSSSSTHSHGSGDDLLMQRDEKQTILTSSHIGGEIKGLSKKKERGWLIK